MTTAVAIDVINAAGRTVTTAGSWDVVLECLCRLPAGVYEIHSADGTLLVVATVAVDGTWIMRGGRRRR